MGGRGTHSQVPEKCGAGSFQPSLVSMVMIPAKARDLAAAGAPLLLPPLHHLLHLHTWPGAAAAASAPGSGILLPQGGASRRLRGLLFLRPRSPGLQPLLPQTLWSQPPTSLYPGVRGFRKHRQNGDPETQRDKARNGRPWRAVAAGPPGPWRPSAAPAAPSLPP